MEPEVGGVRVMSSMREKIMKDAREMKKRNRELTRCLRLPTVSNGSTAVGAHGFVASLDPEQHCYVQ